MHCITHSQSHILPVDSIVVDDNIPPYSSSAHDCLSEVFENFFNESSKLFETLFEFKVRLNIASDTVKLSAQFVHFI